MSWPSSERPMSLCANGSSFSQFGANSTMPLLTKLPEERLGNTWILISLKSWRKKTRGK
ncbi:Uncharacterized protein APZ42_010012 [Daphnia magna]|uniref:Uncharacterized protein n=1 Tax=Daphnia magna TaxID=35525 RepID=A0A164DM88_9CRUS|nr:Uncharacterized protein APZ42_010012 [Daphnia magna]